MFVGVDVANVSNRKIFKFPPIRAPSNYLTFITACKKDHSRTDYRKADKMRPGIWYLILASTYLVITIWSLYFVCSMYFSVQDTICQSATFVDTINMGKETET